MQQEVKPPLRIYLAAPRGFCAGVDRAIQIVEQALHKFGAPVFVRHEIVHNRFVVERLQKMGAVFVDELDEVAPDRPVIFSAHGVPKSVPAVAVQKGLQFFDATCPLVSKVHHEAARHDREGREILLIGHAGHPEVIGTMGQLADGKVQLIETVEDAQAVTPADPAKLAYITQTTLSVDDTAEIIAVLKARFREIAGPHREDICYATTNRQLAAKTIASKCGAMLVLGAPNSSNSKRLVEVALRAGCPRAELVQRAADLEIDGFSGISALGITAGASAPEILVQEVLRAFEARFSLTVEEVAVTQEAVEFKLPRDLTG